MKVLVLRPEPGASETAGKARAMGLEPVVAPLFHVLPMAWTPPAASDFDAVMLTSANAPRHAGPGLEPLLPLPCYSVGERTAEEAEAAGFSAVRIGPGDGDALARSMRADGVRRALHLCGREHLAAGAAGLSVVRIPVYASEPSGDLPAAAMKELRAGAVALLHSWRAAGRFRLLVDEAGIARSDVKVAAISPAAAAAAGSGWRSLRSADRPRDEALLELAAKLCKGGGLARTEDGR